MTYISYGCCLCSWDCLCLSGCDLEAWNLTIVGQAHNGAVYSVKFAGGKSTLLATGSYDATARIWDVEKGGKEVSCFRGHRLSILDLAWTPSA